MNEENPNDSCATIGSTRHCDDHRSSHCDVSDDILNEILSWLPLKSLFRFMSVSKSWSSLISNTFSLRPLGPVSGLLYCTVRMRPCNDQSGYIDLSDACNSYCRKAIESWSSNKNCMEVIESWKAVLRTSDVDLTLVHYCYGLFLLCNQKKFPLTYHICNHTTNQCFALPEPPLHPNLKSCVSSSALAFDPTLSPHYKVLQFSTHPYSRGLTYVDIFSSKERRWINRKALWVTFSQYRLHERPTVFFFFLMELCTLSFDPTLC